MKDEKFKGEDAGFAINGGKGWSNVVFNNHKIDLNGPTAQAMGDYTFTDATSGDKVNVYYTFGYKRNDDGKVRIHPHRFRSPPASSPATPPPHLSDHLPIVFSTIFPFIFSLATGAHLPAPLVGPLLALDA